MDKKSTIKEIIEWIYCIIIAVVLALLVKYFIGIPTMVQQQSMETTFMSGDRLILSRLTKTIRGKYKRGDIITFEEPSDTIIPAADVNNDNPVAHYTYQPKSIFGKFTYYVLEINKISYIKRIIGVEGDHIEIKDGALYLNDEKQDEPYLDEGTVTDMGQYGVYSDIIVPNDCVFVMGDNREHSIDSRCFGCIPISKIEGKVWIRFWPLSKFGKVD